MTVPERIAAYLKKNTPHAYCDDCLQKLLRLARRQEAQQTTKPLGLTEAFTREPGRCFNCGNERQRLVIRAN